MNLQLSVPLPPSTNNLYATVRGYRILTEDARAYKAEVGWLVKAAGFTVTTEQRLALTLRLWFPTPRRADISNRVKLLEDGICEALGIDDSQIDRLLVERAGVDAANPRCEVEMEILV